MVKKGLKRPNMAGKTVKWLGLLGKLEKFHIWASFTLIIPKKYVAHLGQIYYSILQFIKKYLFFQSKFFNSVIDAPHFTSQ